jgi:hypothetical protein
VKAECSENGMHHLTPARASRWAFRSCGSTGPSRNLDSERSTERIGRVTQKQWSTVDEYVAALLAPHDPALEAARSASEAAGLPAIQVSPPQGKLLWLLAKSIGASSILEFGTLGAYSTIWLGRALPAGGPPAGALPDCRDEGSSTRVARCRRHLR